MAYQLAKTATNSIINKLFQTVLAPAFVARQRTKLISQ